MIKELNDEGIHDAWCSFEGENITDGKHKVNDGDRAVARKAEQERDEEWIKWLDDNNVIAIHKDKSLNELGWLITMEKRQELKKLAEVNNGS